MLDVCAADGPGRWQGRDREAGSVKDNPAYVVLHVRTAARPGCSTQHGGENESSTVHRRAHLKSASPASRLAPPTCFSWVHLL